MSETEDGGDFSVKNLGKSIQLDENFVPLEGAVWMWCSFADPGRPEGEQFLGVAIVRSLPHILMAVQAANFRGCNPGGEVVAIPLPESLGPPPPEWDHKLVSDKAEIERLVELWRRR